MPRRRTELAEEYNTTVEKTLKVNGEAYECVVSQRGQGFVYRGQASYLRLGSPERIAELLRRHRLLADAGAPVARILDAGAIGQDAYYIEESLGDERFGQRFRREWETGAITDEAFLGFLDMTVRFTRAQLSGGASLGSSDLRRGIRLGIAIAEASEFASQLEARFEDAVIRLSNMPTVACHGDFNPQNILPQGIIDFEDMFAGPFGYDQVSGIYTTELNPEGDYEFPARYRFSESQKLSFYEALDGIFAEAALPALSSVRRDLEFCRAVWAATRMDEWPKTRAWRYLHLKAFLDDTIAS